MTPKITHYCTIKDRQVNLDDKLLYSAEDYIDFPLFMKSIYKYFEMDYPKFYKMDPLCKFSLIMSYFLLEKEKKEIDANMGILLSNASSCIDIDQKHQRTIEENGWSGARPANFVYTLPNIALGEISIKYNLRSENSFFIFDHFNPKFLIDYSKSWIELGKCESVLCGWVEVHGNVYNGLMFTLEEGNGLDLTEDNLLKLIE